MNKDDAKDDAKDEVRRIPWKYRRRHKTNKPKPTTEEKEPNTGKLINFVTFTLDQCFCIADNIIIY